jgi:hypothetical protein
MIRPTHPYLEEGNSTLNQSTIFIEAAIRSSPFDREEENIKIAMN